MRLRNTDAFRARTISSSPNALTDDRWMPFGGWPLAEFGCLAEVTDTPGLLLFANRARPRWRQAVFLALAVDALNTPDLFLMRIGNNPPDDVDPLKYVAERLPLLSPLTIINGCFDEIPNGLMPVLGKLGHEPLEARTYRRIIEWLGDPTHDRRRRILQQLVTIDQSKIDVLEELDDILLAFPVVATSGTRDDAAQLNRRVAFIQRLCADATPDALRQSACALHGISLVNSWTASWLRRADQLGAPPFPADAQCQPITTAPELAGLARRFRNCLVSHYMQAFLGGRITIVEYLPEPGALALLARLDAGWWVTLSVHVSGNGPVETSLEQMVRHTIASKSERILNVASVDPIADAILRKVFPMSDFFNFEAEIVHR
jgi:hypothetical protein